MTSDAEIIDEMAKALEVLTTFELTQFGCRHHVWQVRGIKSNHRNIFERQALQKECERRDQQRIPGL